MPYNTTSVFIFKRIKNKIQLKWNAIKKKYCFLGTISMTLNKGQRYKGNNNVCTIIHIYVNEIIIKKFPENRNKKKYILNVIQ